MLKQTICTFCRPESLKGYFLTIESYSGVLLQPLEKSGPQTTGRCLEPVSPVDVLGQRFVVLGETDARFYHHLGSQLVLGVPLPFHFTRNSFLKHTLNLQTFTGRTKKRSVQKFSNTKSLSTNVSQQL